MSRFLIVSVVLLVTSSLAACNTIAGVGEDISGASRSVQQKL